MKYFKKCGQRVYFMVYFIVGKDGETNVKNNSKRQ